MENVKVKPLQGQKFNFVTMLLYISATLALGMLSGYFGKSYVGYSGLLTPPAAAPDFVFAIVWPVLYALLGVSLYLVMRADITRDEEMLSYKKISITLWTVSFMFCLTWVPMFFVAHAYTMSFIWLSIMLSLSVMNMIINIKISRIAFILLIPYVMWLMYVGYLNLFIAILN